MASPITLHIVPNSGLEVILDSQYAKTKSESNNIAIKYTIKNKNEMPLLPDFQHEEFHGFMSPINRVTLPSAVMTISGIPLNANYFSFLHPPLKLATAIDWDYFKESNQNRVVDDLDIEITEDCTKLHDVRKFLKAENKWAMPLVSLLGGFAYFNEDFEGNLQLLSVNVISLHKTKFDFRFSGPFEASTKAIDLIARWKRSQPLILDPFHEVGFVASAWIRPGETFHCRSPIVKMDSCPHGGILFYRDDGSAVIYMIESTGYIDQEGDTSPIADVFQTKQDYSFLKCRVGFTENHCLSIDCAKLRNNIRAIAHHRTSSRTDLTSSIDNERTLLHKAIYSQCSDEIIQCLLHDEIENLIHQDKVYGWTPLMFACRYKPHDVELILALIGKSPESVSLKDKYDRSALHIACASMASEEVVKALIDTSASVVFQQTRFMGNLPIHIACGSNASIGVIRSLLQADQGKETVSQKTNAGRLPLHVAVEFKMNSQILRILLGADLSHKLERDNSDGSIELSLKNYNNATYCAKAIYEPFNGALPLHIACWNNSQSETIKLLLDQDEENSSVFKKVDEPSLLVSNIDLLDNEERLTKKSKTKRRRKNSEDSSTIDDEAFDQDMASFKRRTVAIHLAAKHGNKKVIEILLNKEQESQFQASTVQMQDYLGRCPIHIACESTCATPYIIEDLLEADLQKSSIRIADDRGYKAIHYACDRNDANPNILDLLFDAESRFIAMANNSEQLSRIRSMAQTSENRKRSPLYLAVQCGASDAIIEKLLSPKYFYLKGLDDEMESSLAHRCVKNTAIQDCVISKLTERCFFNLLFVDIYANVCALVFFLLGSEKLLYGQKTYFEPQMLILCLVVFISRTTIQIKSRGSQFFSDSWNWCQMIYIVFLGLATNSMMTYDAIDETFPDRHLLTITCALLVAQFTFFLKATFLPFARFVGGLLIIFNTLVPFFIVSGLLLLAFAYGYRMSGEHDDVCPSLQNCYEWTLNGFFSGSEDTADMLDILFGVIAIVVLLNVLIAIVSEAWDTAADRAIHLFWKFRLQFLADARFLSYLDNRYINRIKVSRTGEFFDSFPDIRLADKILWTKSPYDLIKKKKQYDEPFAYFPPDIANQITTSHSLEADLFWAGMDSRRKRRSIWETKIVAIATFMKWFLKFVIYILLVVCGLFTGKKVILLFTMYNYTTLFLTALLYSFSAGWTWPKRLRRHLLEVGVNSKKGSTNEDKTTVQQDCNKK